MDENPFLFAIIAIGLILIAGFGGYILSILLGAMF